MKQCSGIDVHFTGWEPARIADLVAAERNNRRHGDEQVALLAKNIRALGWRWPVIVSELSGRIVAGHCRVEAARLIGADCVPVVRQTFVDAAHEEAFRLADNRIAELAEIQTETIKGLLAELDNDKMDMDLTGYARKAIEELAAAVHGQDEDDTYTRKIVAPVYEPKGECPQIADLFDREKTARLITEIDAAGLPDDVAAFLRLAAERHTAFHFRRIAEYYCHASPQVQDLMEKSGMVIIDFKSYRIRVCPHDRATGRACGLGRKRGRRWQCVMISALSSCRTAGRIASTPTIR